MDGRRMLPDYEMLVAAGYDYLPVGGLLMRGERNPDGSRHDAQSAQDAIMQPALA